MQDSAQEYVSTARSGRAALFALGTFLALLLVIVLLVIPPSWDVFTSANKPFLKLLDRLPVEDILPFKMAHAEYMTAYEVGIFGNSRSYPVQGKLLVGEGKFFNFSIGSQSFRNSVRMLEALVERGKAPRYAIIQFNHVELSLDNEAPLYPRRLFQFSRERLLEAKWLLENGQSLKSTLVHLYNIFIWEMDRERSILNARYIFERLKLHLVPVLYRLKWIALGDAIKGPDASRYRSDGSRKPIFHLDITKPFAYPYRKGRRNSRYPLLEFDFAKLVRVTEEAGTSVLIYETPLMEHVRKRIESNLSSNARSVRRRLKVLCRSTSFICLDAPSIPHSTKNPWADSSHPPARLLEKFLKDNLDILKLQ